MSDLATRSAAIRLLVLDVDGVLTDGTILLGGGEIEELPMRQARIAATHERGIEVRLGRRPAVARRMTGWRASRVPGRR
jgi:hypothetical protein